MHTAQRRARRTVTSAALSRPLPPLHTPLALPAFALRPTPFLPGTMALSRAASRAFSAAAAGSGSKVTVLGAAGGIGQPLSLLLKEHPLVADLSLYDIVGTPGVAADLGHINTGAKVRAAGAGRGHKRGGRAPVVRVLPPLLRAAAAGRSWRLRIALSFRAAS